MGVRFPPHQGQHHRSRHQRDSTQHCRRARAGPAEKLSIITSTISMDFDLSKAQKLLQQSARDFFARECKPERVRELMATETAFDDKLWREMADQGFTGLTIPE